MDLVASAILAARFVIGEVGVARGPKGPLRLGRHGRDGRGLRGLLSEPPNIDLLEAITAHDLL